MRFLKTLGLGLAAALAACSNTPCGAAGDDIAAASWHFAGGADLANNTNFDNIKKTLTLAPSLDFRNLALTRFSGWLGKSIFLTTNGGAEAALRPLLDDALSAESVWAVGGASNGPLNFMVALRLNEARAQAWQAALPKVTGVPGQSFQAQGFTGQQWKIAGGQSFWLVRAKDWLLAGGGDDLRALQTQYLQQISQKGRPAPVLNPSWLEADVDWPRLAHWLPNFPRLFQLARTKITFTAPDQSLFMSAKVIYPKPVPWKFEPWRIPTRIVRDPLISFTAGQDIAAFLDPGEPLAKLTDNPLNGEFFVWALGEMGLQSYGAWRVADATNSIQRVAAEATNIFNPAFKQNNWGELRWQPERKTLLWANLCPILFPMLQIAPETNGQYLVVSCFPLELRNKPAPEALFQQFTSRTNVVYYDWEGTGNRLEQWRLLSGMLPVLPRVQMLPGAANSTNRSTAARSVTSSASTNNSATQPRVRPPIIVVENWLSGVTPMLRDHDTVTEITRTGPAELTVVRRSPFAVTSLELVLLSHWLSGTGSPGINPSLLPPPARMSGPGINPGNPAPSHDQTRGQR
jgi:hypothetical protein